MKRILMLMLLLTVALCYVACASKSGKTVTNAPSASQAVMKDGESAEGGQSAMGDSGSALLEQQKPTDDRKIIYDSILRMEAIDFVATQDALNAAVKQAGGYASSTSLNNDSYEGAMRYATYEYRIPADQYTSFLSAMKGAGNVTSQEESTQDITAEYVDVEARLKSLKTQEESLLEMLGEAGNLETMLAIQNQLTEVQYRIESHTAQQRTYDTLVNYCTVTVQVQEVKHTTAVKVTFGNRIQAAFRDSWIAFAEGCKSFVIVLVYLLPTLLVLAVLGAIVFGVVRIVSKHMEKSGATRKTQTDTPVQSNGVQPHQYQASQEKQCPPKE